jgi:1-acyl-sn-glycerol-3-phosphate acyltransferase
MDDWHYDPAAHIDFKEMERLQVTARIPRLLVGGVRSLAAVVSRAWLHAYHRLTIAGRHNLPEDRSFILIANHASHLDTLCLLSALPISRLHRSFPAAAKDYFCVNALRAFFAKVVVNALPFDRQSAPLPSLSACAHLLETPRTVLLLFPEGTRSAAPEPGEFKPGVGLLAAGRDIPIVPCYLGGTNAALPKGAWLPRPRAIGLAIGAPRVYAHLPPTKESAKLICRDLRQAVIMLGQAQPDARLAGPVSQSHVLDSPPSQPVRSL